MNFFPFGMHDGQVIDPERVAREFQEASRVAGKTSWWQFLNEGFTSIDLLEKGTHVQPVVVTPNHSANILQTSPGTEPDLTTATGRAVLWQIPYNRSLQEIGDGDIEVTWTSSYPEMVFQVFSFQYIRYPERAGAGPKLDLPAAHFVRTQVQLKMDGAIIPGTGPFGLPTTGKASTRGTNRRSLATTLFAVSMLPAGTHSANAVAGQAPTTPVGSAGEDATLPLEDPPDEGVCIAHRNHFVLRFAMGGWAGS